MTVVFKHLWKLNVQRFSLSYDLSLKTHVIYKKTTKSCVLKIFSLWSLRTTCFPFSVYSGLQSQKKHPHKKAKADKTFFFITLYKTLQLLGALLKSSTNTSQLKSQTCSYHNTYVTLEVNCNINKLVNPKIKLLSTSFTSNTFKASQKICLKNWTSLFNILDLFTKINKKKQENHANCCVW